MLSCATHNCLKDTTTKDRAEIIHYWTDDCLYKNRICQKYKRQNEVWIIKFYPELARELKLIK